jgi:N-acetylated-alpha-linked acidic dipeptidase
MRGGIGQAFFVSWFALFLLSQSDHAQSTAPGSTGADVSADTPRRPISPFGFAPASRAAELDAEAKALAVPTPENARKWLRTLTEEPHLAGSPADYKTAVFVRDRLREWGWKADLATNEVLLNYPVGTAQIELTRPVPKNLARDEAPLATDKDSSQSNAAGAFYGYGASGVASGQVVYANYARSKDFAELDKLGISVEGKIVLARYGGNFRGLKVFNAQKRGATGILIYSDPADDGYAKGDVYPAGPFRPGSAIQRGSVQFLSMGPGDPSTPKGPSVKNSERLPIDTVNGFPLDPPHWAQSGIEDIHPGKDWEAKTGLKREDYFATIPSLPLSYDAAREILNLLAGPEVPSGWQGGLPFAYHVGPGPAELRFTVRMDYQIRTIWNVIGTLAGADEPDRWIMLGNHRDAWVYGAVDPGSGTAATLETCRALGAAVKSGWTPRRTLLYASWDAEEYGLVGSTEWAEEHASEIDQKATLLLNVDSAVGGRQLDLGGVPSLRDLALDAAAAVTDIRTGKTLREEWLESKRSAWAVASPLLLSDPLWTAPTTASGPGRTESGPASSAPPRGFVPQLQPLGSGSDYTVFLDHLGIPAMDIGFSGRYGVYHSIYDNFNWMERFGDPEFLTHTLAARFITVILMRAAAAEVLPWRFAPYGEALRDHVDELRLIQARHDRDKAKTPTGQEAATDISGNFDGLPKLVQAVKNFQAQAAILDRSLDVLSSRDWMAARDLAAVNQALSRVERAFLLPEGLRDRTWFRHAIYAPGVSTGYGAWPMPLIRHVLEDHASDRLPAAVDRTVATLQKATEALRLAYDMADKVSRERDPESRGAR